MTPVSPIKTLRLLLSSEIALVAGEMIFSPQPAETPEMNRQLLMLGCLALIILTTHVFGLIGLWYKKGWARLTYTASIACFVIYSVVAAPEPETALSSSLAQLENFLVGAILCFIWFAMQDDFERPATRAAKVFS